MKRGLTDAEMSQEADAAGEPWSADSIAYVRRLVRLTLADELVPAPSDTEGQAGIYRELLNYQPSDELRQHIMARLTRLQQLDRPSNSHRWAMAISAPKTRRRPRNWSSRARIATWSTRASAYDCHLRRQPCYGTAVGATPACLLATQNWGGSERISTPNALRATAPTPPAGSTPARRPTAANATSPSTVTGWCWRSWSPSRRSRTATRRSGCSPHCAPRSPPSPWYGPIVATPGAS